MLLTCKRIYFCTYRWKFCNLCIKEIVGIKSILLISPWFALIYQNSYSYIIALNIFPARNPSRPIRLQRWGLSPYTHASVRSPLYIHICSDPTSEWHIISPTSFQKAPKLGELFGGVLRTGGKKNWVYTYQEKQALIPYNKTWDGSRNTYMRHHHAAKECSHFMKYVETKS